jgi:hypothetical protein
MGAARASSYLVHDRRMALGAASYDSSGWSVTVVEHCHCEFLLAVRPSDIHKVNVRDCFALAGITLVTTPVS